MTNNTAVTPSLVIDEEWQLQGRIGPPSCNPSHECILFLQTKKVVWPREHFHLAQIVIPPEMGVELQATILYPPEEKLLTDSWIPEEQVTDIEYLSMYKFSIPENTIGFSTINGLVFVIENKTLNQLFNKMERCNYCNPIAGFGFTGNLDELMLVTKGEKNH